MADVKLTLTWDETIGDGGYRVTLPDGRAFETGDRFAWPTKELAEAAVRKHFGELRARVAANRSTVTEDPHQWARWGAWEGQSGADVEADLRLIGIDPATGVDSAAEAGAGPPQRQEGDAGLRGVIAHRIEDLEERRLALAVEMLEVQGAIEALRGRAMVVEALAAVTRAQLATEGGGE